MPLPPAPTKRAARLAPESYDNTNKQTSASTAKPTARARSSSNSGKGRLLETSMGMGTPPSQTHTPVVTTAKNKPQALAPLSAQSPLLPKSTERTARNPKQQTSTAPQLGLAFAAQAAPSVQPTQNKPVSVAVYAPNPTPVKVKKAVGPAKLFVLDTNVLLHDPMCLFRFEEHDIFLPMIVLEELDGHKKGMTEVARNGRQTSRTLDALVAAHGTDMALGLKLDTTGHREAGGKLFFQTQSLTYTLPLSLPQGKADNQILGVVEALRRLPENEGNGKSGNGREVVLVSKDINMRVKARALGLAAEDYQNDKTLDDGDLLYAGSLALPADFWTTHGQTVESWQNSGHTFYRISGPIVPSLYINQFVYFEVPGEPSLYARVTEIRATTAVLKTLKDYGHIKNAVWGVTTRNREQSFAMNVLMDPEVDFVTLAGTAGTGKTLMALAAGLTQVLDERRYTEIIMTRATVSVGEDIGFLPGTEEEKMGPWMGALDDNLEFLAKGDGGGAGEWGRAATNELVRSRIKIKSMNFMRGRTFMNKYVIIDEAQNLTPKQMKTLITRAGPGTKIICMGNLAQIDTPYLTEGSSGLTFAVDKFKGWPHGGHITLARGERSRLADFASEVL